MHRFSLWRTTRQPEKGEAILVANDSLINTVVMASITCGLASVNLWPAR